MAHLEAFGKFENELHAAAVEVRHGAQIEDEPRRGVGDHTEDLGAHLRRVREVDLPVERGDRNARLVVQTHLHGGRHTGTGPRWPIRLRSPTAVPAAPGTTSTS